MGKRGIDVETVISKSLYSDVMYVKCLLYLNNRNYILEVHVNLHWRFVSDHVWVMSMASSLEIYKYEGELHQKIIFVWPALDKYTLKKLNQISEEF